MGGVQITFGIDDRGYSAGVERIRRNTKQLKGEIGELGHRSVSSMQAASAAIRIFEGDVQNNIRAVERFVGSTLGWGNALKGIFPVVGALAFAGVIYRMGEEATEAFRKVQQLPTVLTNGFRDMNASALTANDTLRVTNDRLENEIAKLQGKPQNNLALAIDEARLAADKFADSLDRDNKGVQELLKQNNIGGLAALFTNRQSTSSIAGTITSYSQQLSDLGARYDLAAHGHTEEAGGSTEDLLKQINDKRGAAIAAMTAAVQAAKTAQAKPSYMNSAPLLQGMDIGSPDQQAVIADATGFRAKLFLQGESQEQGSRNSTDEAQRAKLQVRRDAMEASRQAAAQLMQQWHRDLDSLQELYGHDLVMEARFWDQRAMLTRKGGLATAGALDEANKAIAQMRTQNMHGQKEFDRTAAQSYLPGSMDLSRGDTSDMQKEGQGATEYLRNLNEGIQLQHANSSAIAEASIRMEEMTGRMSRLNAAQALASLHTREYKDATDALAEALEHAQSLPAGFERDQRIAGLRNQGTQMGGQRSLQIMQDQQNVTGNTIDGAARDSLNKMVQSFNDLAANLKDIIPKMVEGLNDDLAKFIEGHGKAADFGKTLSRAGDSMIKASLQKIEGGFLSAAGLGKPDGSQSNPIWTRDANGVASVGGTKFPFIQPFFGGQQGSTGQQGNGKSGGGGSVWGNLLHSLTSGLFKGGNQGGSSGTGGDDDDGDGSFFQGSFAGGGDVLAHHPAMVGERGPEMFIPRSAGRIVPNNQLTGGGDTHVYHIDARGATDPAAIHAAVARALPHAVAASAQTQHQMRVRTPQGR
jgi:hypothetical protein